MSWFRGRPRLGTSRKQSYTVALEPMVADRLRSLGRGNLSGGIAIAEHQSRGMAIPVLRSDVSPAGWIVFELVDGPADPPPVGETIDAWRDHVHAVTP